MSQNSNPDRIVSPSPEGKDEFGCDVRTVKPEATFHQIMVERLGECKIKSPITNCEDVSRRCIFHQNGHGVDALASHIEFETFEHAGAREYIYFDPAKTKVGILSAGGICPGLNNVIRGLVLCLWHRYGVRNIIGFKYGYEGLNPALSQTIELNPHVVKDIHTFGGSLLGSSRGPQKVETMVDYLQENKFDIVFCIGGDGTMAGANALVREVQRRGLKISIVGVPKTIDNDIVLTDSFGFQTAVEMAQTAITSAHNEARSFKNGIGIVKLMGRESGFIALHASIASGDVNLLLLPEIPFSIDKVVDLIKKRFQEARNTPHCVIVVAEGAGQHLLATKGFDESGNKKYDDIALFLKTQIEKHLKEDKVEHTIKLIDPSYIIRAARANPSDSVFCLALAQAAVHAAMSGRTACMIGHMNGHFVHIPMQRVAGRRKFVDPHGFHYQIFLDNTGQPMDMQNL